jgi:hypothetical protein
LTSISLESIHKIDQNSYVYEFNIATIIYLFIGLIRYYWNDYDAGTLTIDKKIVSLLFTIVGLHEIYCINDDLRYTYVYFNMVIYTVLHTLGQIGMLVGYSDLA